MKNFLLGVIAFSLVGIFIFLGFIIFQNPTDEVAVTTETETVEADTSADNEDSEVESEADDRETGNGEQSDGEEAETEEQSEDDGQPEALLLEEELSNQDVTVENVEYLIQDDRHKALYPDMLSVIVKNDSDLDIKDITYGFVAWDSNGLPVRLKGSIDFSDGQFFSEGEGQSVNIAPGETFGRGYGWELDEEMDKISSFKAIVTEYEGFNGEKFQNPLLNEFRKIYEGKRLADIKGYEETVVNRYETRTGSESSSFTDDSSASTGNEEAAGDFVTDYLYALEDAYALGDFSIIENYLLSGTATYDEMRDNVEYDRFPNLTIYSVEVTDYRESADNIYVEIISERTNDNLDQIYEYRTGYTIVEENGSWKIELFEDL